MIMIHNNNRASNHMDLSAFLRKTHNLLRIEKCRIRICKTPAPIHFNECYIL